MVTMYLPNFNSTDIFRLHRLELIAVKKVDRMLCSKNMSAIRLIMLSELEKCQKHTTKRSGMDFICQSRKVIMNHIFDSCSDISDLPPALILQVDQTHFIVDHPKSKVTINCRLPSPRILYSRPHRDIEG